MKGNKLFLTMGILSLLIMLFLAACGSQSDEQTSGDEQQNDNGTQQSEDGEQQSETQKPVDMVIASNNPPQHWINSDFNPKLIEMVEEKTDGAIKGQLHAGSSLGGGPTQALQDLTGGVFDISVLSTMYFTDTPLFLTTAVNLPFLFLNADDYRQMHDTVVNFSEKMNYREIFEEAGIHLIHPITIEPSPLISTKPVHSIEDLKGKKVFAPNETWVSIIKEWGATPVSMQFTELYTALERNTIDVAIFPLYTIYTNKLYEVAPYITMINTFIYQAGQVMSPQLYDSLTEENKKFFFEELPPQLMETWVEKSEETYGVTLENFLNEFQEGDGEIIELSSEEANTFVESAKHAWQEWVDQANEKGYDGKEILNTLLESMEEVGVEPPFDIDFIQ